MLIKKLIHVIQKNKPEKATLYIFVLLIIIFVFSSIFLVTTYYSTKNELAKIHKTHYLCNSKFEVCNTSSTTKGVCAPGKKCS